MVGDVNYVATLPRVVLCDLDGTVATIHGRNPYDGVNCATDLPNWPVIECLRAMVGAGVGVIFVSGRNEAARSATKDWLDRHVRLLPNGAPLPYIALHMRPDGDTRPDAVVKSEIFDREIRDRYHVLFVLDDRRKVVREWRRLGLTVFQVNDGPMEKDDCVHCGGSGTNRALVGDEKEAAVALATLCSRPTWENNLVESERVIKSIVKAVSKGRAR